MGPSCRKGHLSERGVAVDLARKVPQSLLLPYHPPVRGMSREEDREYEDLQTHSRRTVCDESMLTFLHHLLDPRRQHQYLTHESRGYHALESSFGKIFHVEKRWKLVREMGSGAYGVVMRVFAMLILQIVSLKFQSIQLSRR